MSAFFWSLIFLAPVTPWFLLALCVVVFPRQSERTVWATNASLIFMLAVLLPLAFLVGEGLGLFAFRLYTAFILFLILCPGILAFRKYRSKVSAVLTAVAVAAVIGMQVYDLTPRKAYIRFFKDIRMGMTAEEVMTQLHRHFPADGRFPQPVLFSKDPSKFITFSLDPTQGAYNAELIWLELDEGGIIKKTYSYD